MSWEDKIQNRIQITTGDGKIYEPEYLIEPNSNDFNIAEFDFPLVSGTLVKRGMIKGTRMTLQLYFQGADQLDKVAEFKESSKDRRYWTVNHPVHGLMYMHPASLTYDPSGLNTTKITAVLIETITEDAPRVTVVPREQIIKNVEVFQEKSGEVFEQRLKASSQDISGLTLNMLGIYDEAAPLAKDSIQANEYFNLFTTANAKILDLTAEPLIAITAVQSAINYPALFTLSVKDRLNMLINQFTILSNGIEELLTPDEKLIYENNASNVIAAMVTAIVNPLNDDDYGNAVDVLDVIELLSGTYDDFALNLDAIQTDTGGDIDSYIPSYEPISALTDLVNYTISNLFQIALSANQERIVYLEYDSNYIVQCHRFYGLDASDSLLNKFIRNNKIGLNEKLQLKKGREIKYYV